MSGSRIDPMEELNANSTEDNGVIAHHLYTFKRWFLSHAQYLNFVTVLMLASVSFGTFFCCQYLILTFVYLCYISIRILIFRVNYGSYLHNEMEFGGLFYVLLWHYAPVDDLEHMFSGAKSSV